MEECVECLEQGSRRSILQFMPFTMVSYVQGGVQTGGDKKGEECLLHQTLLGKVWISPFSYQYSTKSKVNIPMEACV